MIRSKDERIDMFKYYIYEGNTVYTYPAINQVSFSGLLQDPLDSSLFYTTPEPLFNLESGIEYIVTQGSVTDGTTVFKKGETFTYSGGTYSGNGVVYRTTKVINSTKDMDYPISPDMAQRIILEILSKDFRLERQTIADIFNDAKDQLQIVRDGE